jgi:transposase InsO family protein
LEDNEILASVGPQGTDSTTIQENFCSTLKIKLVNRTSWRTRDQAENAIFAYIDGWYNTRGVTRGLDDRRHDEYEAAWYATVIDSQWTAAAELTNAI